MHLQLIDDDAGKTLVGISDLRGPAGPRRSKKKTRKTSKKSVTKIQTAHELGVKLAKMALKKKIKNVVFDRGGYKYHGRVKAAAEGVRKGGLVF